MRWICALILTLLPITAHAALDCNETILEGPFGFQISGSTTISGTETPVVGIARIKFDGHGAVSGVSTVNFNGLLLGNPVTGTYKVNSDCSLALNLQDDSGAFQHFAGKIVRGTNRIIVRQTDTGTGERGVIVKTTDACQSANLQGRYTFTLSGAFTPLAAGGLTGPISASGTIDADGAGKFTLTRTVARNGTSIPLTTPGTFEVASDCFTTLEFTLPAAPGGTELPIKMRGVLVQDGRELLAIGADPGETVSAQFTAR
jgi:hypothetical protein